MINTERIGQFAENTGCAVLRNAPLADYTTFKIGGPAELLLLPEDSGVLCDIIKECRSLGETPFIFGNGSNLLVSDEGVRGVTICTGRLCGISMSDSGVICCSAGEPVSKLCSFALENSLTGLEFAFGIPGSVGGALFMNAGAYGGEFADVVTGCDYITSDGTMKYIDASAMDLSYRHSVFEDKDAIICNVYIKLCTGDKASIKSGMNDFLSRRRDKQPLSFPSAGSVFKRPEGHYAGALIEQCGLKGHSIGGAMVSEKHAGFIVNTGSATAKDVIRLIEYIRNTVFEHTGILLEPEVRIIG